MILNQQKNYLKREDAISNKENSRNGNINRLIYLNLLRDVLCNLVTLGVQFNILR
jgi:hypothetical protein